MPSFVERVSMINSEHTQLNSDYDFSALNVFLLEHKGGILFSGEEKSEFKLADGFIGEDGKVAKAVVLCIRPSSNPISNEKFLACFSLFGKKTISTANGNKIYIEINPELVNDPTLIKDEGTSTDFALGFNIGEIKSTPDYPTHSNYLPLYEIDSEGDIVDVRREISVNIKDTATIQALNREIEKQDDNIKNIEQIIMGIINNQGNSINAIAEENILKNDVCYLDVEGYEQPNETVNLGDDDTRIKYAVEILSSKLDDNEVDIYIQKVSNPQIGVTVRIETDDGTGKPSGELIYSGATLYCAPANITQELNKVKLFFNDTINFEGKRRFVFYMGQGDIEVSNPSAYYKIGVYSNSKKLGYVYNRYRNDWESYTYKETNITKEQSNSTSTSTNRVGYYFRCLRDFMLEGVKLWDNSPFTRVLLLDSNNNIISIGNKKLGNKLLFDRPLWIGENKDGTEYRLQVDANGSSVARQYLNKSPANLEIDRIKIINGIDNTSSSTNMWGFNTISRSEVDFIDTNPNSRIFTTLQPNTISISVNPVGYYFSNVKKDTRIYGVRLVEGSEATRIILRDQNNQLLATGTTRKGDILYFNKPVVMYADNSDGDSIDYRLLVDANGVSFNRKYIGNSSRQQSNDYFVIGQGMDNTGGSNNFWEFVEILYDDPYINYKVSNFPIYLYSNSFASSYLKKATYKNIMSVVGISISNTLQGNVGSIQIGGIYNGLNFSPKDIQINGIRYIKDTINGNNVDNVNYWSSIIAMDGAVDRAYGIIPTSEGELTNAEDVTDGDFTDYATGETGQEQTITLDLGDVYEIDTIIISHKNDGRIFNSATTEVSEDGINWYTLIQGPYTEETTGISKEIDYPILETVGNIIGKNMYISSYPGELSELPNGFVFGITLNESSLLIAPEKPEALVVNIDGKIEFLDMVDISEKGFLKGNSMSDSVYEYSKSGSGVLFNGTIQGGYSALPLSVTITGSSDYFGSESKIMDYTYKIIDNSNEQLLYSITGHFTMYVDWDWRTEQKTIIPNFYIEGKDIRIVIDYTIRAPNNENGSFSIGVQNVLGSGSVDYSKYIPSNNPIDLLFALEEKENGEIKAFRGGSVGVFDKLGYNIYNYIYSGITNSSERIQDGAFNENSNSMVIGKYAYPGVINLLNSNSNNNQFFVVMPSNFVAKSDGMLRIGTASTVSLNGKSIGNINNGCIPVRRGDRVSGVNASSNIFIPLF